MVWCGGGADGKMAHFSSEWGLHGVLDKRLDKLVRILKRRTFRHSVAENAPFVAARLRFDVFRLERLGEIPGRFFSEARFNCRICFKIHKRRVFRHALAGIAPFEDCGARAVACWQEIRCLGIRVGGCCKAETAAKAETAVEAAAQTEAAAKAEASGTKACASFCRFS